MFFLDIFITMQRAGLAGAAVRPCLALSDPRWSHPVNEDASAAHVRVAAGAESHSRQARNKFPDRYHRFIIVTHSCGRLDVDNCRIVATAAVLG